MLAPGTRAPDFTAADQNDTPISLSQLLRTGPLILYFYPADFTPAPLLPAAHLPSSLKQ